MSKLTDMDVVNLEFLKDHFQHCIDNVDHILEQKDTDDIDLTYFEWILRDNTSLNGYQNDAVLGTFNELKESYDKLQMEITQ